jgi:hypothetical protein
MQATLGVQRLLQTMNAQLTVWVITLLLIMLVDLNANALIPHFINGFHFRINAVENAQE